MRIILSRKGFDSSCGGCASPILPDGTMLSMPIPSDGDVCEFDEIHYASKSYADIWCELKPSGIHIARCHLDPDIRTGIRENPKDWVPAFGQVNQAETHLEQFNIKQGDLFLFFGWFRETEYRGGKLCFRRDAPDIQAIYGYLQIGEILRGREADRCYWHPHANRSEPNNTIYIASSHLCFEGADSGLPGSGTLIFTEARVLTAPGMSRSRWKLNGIFGEIPLSYHYVGRVKDGYFDSVKRGQEFVFDEDPRVIEWAKSIIFGS